MGALVTRKLHNICPSMTLPESLAEFDLQPDVGFKHGVVQKDLRNIKKSFPDIRFSCLKRSSDLSEYIEHFFDLHEERWRLLGQPGNFHDKRKRDFYRKIAKIISLKERCALSCLHLANRIEAMNLHLVYGDTCYFLQGGVSEIGLQYKAGNILFYYIFNNMLGKFKKAEWLRGDELYKYYWGSGNRYTLEIDIAKTFNGRLVCASQMLFKSFRTAARFILGRKRR